MDHMDELEKEVRDEKYNEYVKEITPVHNLWANMGKAFLVGGLICVLGQFIINFGIDILGFQERDAATFCSIILVLISVILTSLNLYPGLANWGGAGALVPITGFANGVCASAIEYKKEGQVFGIGCQIFKIAGPVILYGIFSSWVLGVIYAIAEQKIMFIMK